MIKKSKHVSIFKEKKLIRELKNQASKSSEKLLHFLMIQEVHEITVQNVLKFSLRMHKMMFQNLSAELQKKIDIDESVMKISSDAIQNADDENAEFKKLWTIEILQFDMNIDKESVPSLLDNDAEVNILLYHVVLALGLTIQTRVKVTM